MPAGEHTVLISAVKQANNVQSGRRPRQRTDAALCRPIRTTGNIWDKYIEVGYVELSSHTNHLCDDGTTAVIETVGLKKNIVFVDAKSMTAQRVSIPSEDIWDVAVSPDKKKVAFTKYEGTYLSDLNFDKIELVLPRKGRGSTKTRWPMNYQRYRSSQMTAHSFFTVMSDMRQIWGTVFIMLSHA